VNGRPRVILPLDSPAATLSLAGGKGANLACLLRAGLPVPGGFLLTTPAYRNYVQANGLEEMIGETLTGVDLEDATVLQTAAKTIRAHFEAGTIPAGLAAALEEGYRSLAQGNSPVPVAVRSSATAEDLPEMSFAGQQDTFLNVTGREALLEAVLRCWSSLWTARAIGYRARNAIPQMEVALAVVVQKMVEANAAGVLFTANPLNGKRMEMVVDATLGLGEALVSGQVEPDHYVLEADSGEIVRRELGAKALSIRSRSGGGTITTKEEASDRPAVPDSVLRELAAYGRRVERLFGTPQDVEWAWAKGQLYVLQSRPITSLYPVPARLAGERLQVLFSFGAVQGMLDPMTPLGQDVMRGAFAGAGTLFGYELSAETQRVVYRAGERLFINVTTLVRHPIGRQVLRKALPLVEPGVAQALESVGEDPRLAPGRLRLRTLRRVARAFLPIFFRFLRTMRRPEQERERIQRYIAQTLDRFRQRSTGTLTLAGRVELLEELLGSGFDLLISRVLPAIATGMASLNLLTHLAKAAPGEHNALKLTRGLPYNVTTEMDLALWATAQKLRADVHAARLITEMEAEALADAYLGELLPQTAQRALSTFLAQYGMRGVAEIDIGRPRWRENPLPVFQTLKSYLQIDDSKQAPDAVFRRGAAAAEAAVEPLARAVARTRGGWLKARLVRAAARRVREVAGLRESPKFLIVRLLGLLRAGLLENGQTLVAEGVLAQADDLFFLTLPELRALAAGESRSWQALVAARRERYAREQKRRQVPRLLLSDGHAFYDGMLPSADEKVEEEVLVGSAVSPGVVEGMVRVVLDPHGVQLAPGEILVCPGTDPAWTPLFLPAGGLVMEVGGLMTHGSVVAREYGIPAVAGVHEATTRLKTGQRVRVDGTAGRVEIVPS